MNAPETIAPATYEHLRRELLTPNKSPGQARRRARFSQEALQELADTIRPVGIIEPIIARRITGATPPAEYEIVAGERRWLAAGLAGLDRVPVLVRDLDDAAALKLQLIENLQRVGLDPLEEAEDYAELRRMENLNAQQLGDMIGRSRAYVYARLKLLDLSPEAQQALAKGDIDSSKALLIARLRSPKLQALALKRIGDRSDSFSHRALVDILRRDFTADLNKAPFSLADERLTVNPSPKDMRNVTPHIGACTGCPNNSHNDPELQADLDPGAHVCTHVPCYQHKIKIHWEHRRIDAQNQGRTVHTGEEALRMLPGGWNSGKNADWLLLDHPNDDLDYSDIEAEPQDDDDDEDGRAWQAWFKREQAWKRPTYRQQLGDGLAELQDQLVLVADKSGQIHELAPIKAAAKILKKQGISIDIPGRPEERQQMDPEAQKIDHAKEAAKRKTECRYRIRLLRAVAAKWKAPLKRDHWLHLLKCESSYIMDEQVGELFQVIHGDQADLDVEEFNSPSAADLDKLKDHDLQRLLGLLPLAGDLHAHSNGKALEAEARRWRIDPGKIKKQVQAEEKARVKAAATADAEKTE